MLAEERKEEAEAALSSLGIVNEKSHAREVSQHYKRNLALVHTVHMTNTCLHIL